MEEWRPFYSFLVGRMMDNYSGSNDPWELLAQNRFDELWPSLFHATDADVPIITAGRLSLIPPPLRKYFENFIAESTKLLGAMSCSGARASPPRTVISGTRYSIITA